MYCRNCGQEVNDEAVVCPHCGCETGKKKLTDESSFGWAFLGFLFPVIGLILYLVWKSDYPLKAASVGKGALVGVLLQVVAVILCYVFVGVALSSLVL